MTTKLLDYDVAKHLHTPEDMTAYLDAIVVQIDDDADSIARAKEDVARAKSYQEL